MHCTYQSLSEVAGKYAIDMDYIWFRKANRDCDESF